MANGINKVILVGNLGADPETRYTSNGSAITTIKIATSESWKDKQTGEAQERTEWHRVKFFGRLAEIAGEYLKKGRQVYIEGSLRTDKYTDKEGIERYTTDVIASEMQMLGGVASNSEGNGRRERSDSERQGSAGRRERGGSSGARDTSRGGHADGGERGAGRQGEPNHGWDDSPGSGSGYGNRNNNGPRNRPAPQPSSAPFEDSEIPF